MIELIYRIIKEGVDVNRIVADATFIDTYCAENGYCYEPCYSDSPTVTPTTEDRISALEEAMLAMMGVTPDV